MDFSWDGVVVHTNLGHFDLTLTSDLIFRFFVSGAYLLYNKCVLCETNSFGGGGAFVMLL